MYARSSTFRGSPDSIDAGIEFVHSEVLPTILVMDGCVGVSMLANRETGHCITVSAWHSPESRKDSETEVGHLRGRIGERLGTTPEVNQWEIALLHRDHRSQEGARARVTWVQTDPAENSRETARGLREKFVHETREQVLDVEQFDLVLAHLHAPELV